MKIKEFKVSNYRSITRQASLSVADFSVLIGANNEGKSNILKALVLGLTLIRRWGDKNIRLEDSGKNEAELIGNNLRRFYAPASIYNRGITASSGEVEYRWDDDYPASKQGMPNSKPTTMQLSFELSEAEKEDFYQEFKFRNNTLIPIYLTLGKTKFTIRIKKQGPHGHKFQENSNAIAKFISNRINYVLVPAIRTEEQSKDIISTLAGFKYNKLVNDKEYKEAINRVESLRQLMMAELGEELRSSIQRYLPNIKSISLESRQIRQLSRISRIGVDDGTEVGLESKGDGVKSLFSLALIEHLAGHDSDKEADNLILIVDEPEAHLHPEAIHRLRDLFTKISKDKQVVVATHSPVFVNRANPEANIIIENNSPVKANSISSIRKAIGLRFEDNLRSAETVILVEGYTDKEILSHCLSQLSDIAQKEINEGIVVFRETNGAAKLEQNIRRERAEISKLVCVLDNDSAGQNAANTVVEKGLLDASDIFILKDGTRHNTTIEDIVIDSVIIQSATQVFGRNFNKDDIKNKSKPVVEVIKNKALSKGFSDSEELLSRKINELKLNIASAIKKIDSNALKESALPSLRALHDRIWG